MNGARDLYDCGLRPRRPPPLPSGTRQLMRIPQPEASSVLSEARLAATGDLLNVTNALFVGPTWSNPGASAAGIVVTELSVVVMPTLGRAKRRLAARLGSAATAGEGTQNLLCAALAGAVLLGLLPMPRSPGGRWTGASVSRSPRSLLARAAPPGGERAAADSGPVSWHRRCLRGHGQPRAGTAPRMIN